MEFNLQIKTYKISIYKTLLQVILYLYFCLNDINTLRYILSNFKCSGNQKCKI